MIPIDFKVTCSKVKVKPLFRAECAVCSISFDPFTWSIPNLVQGLQPCLVHISSNFKFCTKGCVYVSETFLVNKGFLGAYYVTVWTAASFFGTNQFQTFTFDQYKFTSFYATCRFAQKKFFSRIFALEHFISLRMVLIMPWTHVFIT